MINTTLCYLEKDGCWLMLHRTKKQNDLNEGKWIGVGGHVESGETPEECVRREVLEETGLILHSVSFRGVVDFRSERWADEAMYLYTSDDFSGELTDCDEGELAFIPKKDVFSLPLWEGDRAFLAYLLENEPFFHLEVRYDKDDVLVGTKLFPPIVLASASPRRLDIMHQIGLHPVVLPSVCEETCESSDPEELVKALSRMKAADVGRLLISTARLSGSRSLTVIGADTVVTCDDRILGKPGSHEEAAEMIRSLSGRTHEVYTGVTVMRVSGGTMQVEECFAEGTRVHVLPMTEEEILAYADSDEPMDKAGAYGIQGTFAVFISGIDGDYFNVVGLPASRLYRALKGFS